jgi:hypothetical protein
LAAPPVPSLMASLTKLTSVKNLSQIYVKPLSSTQTERITAPAVNIRLKRTLKIPKCWQ